MLKRVVVIVDLPDDAPSDWIPEEVGLRSLAAGAFLGVLRAAMTDLPRSGYGTRKGGSTPPRSAAPCPLPGPPPPDTPPG